MPRKKKAKDVTDAAKQQSSLSDRVLEHPEDPPDTVDPEDTEDDGPLIEQAYKKRGAAIGDLAKAGRDRRDADMKEEGLEVVDTTGEVAIDTATGEDAIETPDETPQDVVSTEETPKTEPETTPEPQAASTTPEQMVKVTIDGEEKEVQLSEIQDAGIRALQKESTADARLKEATRLLDAAKAQPSQPLPAAIPGVGVESTGDTPPSTDPSAEDVGREEASVLAKSIMFGSEEEGTAAVQKLLSVNRGQASATRSDLAGLNQDQLVEFIQRANAFSAAQERFKKPVDEGGYADIWDDPILRKIVADKETEARNTGDKREFWELFSALGDEVREWYSKNRPASAKPVIKERVETKRNAPAVPSAGGRLPIPGPVTEDTPLDRKDVIAGMRKSRHQTSDNL